MNKVQCASIEQKLKRRLLGLCQAAQKMEEYGISYSSVWRQTLSRKELDTIQKYVSNHYIFPEVNGGWDSLENERGENNEKV